MTEPTRPCGTCGMPCTSGEYHPYAACLMFKACHNSETVRANLEAVRGTQAQAGAVPLTEPQITSMWRDQWDGFVSFAEAEVIVRATEEAHGIKGGQHGL